MANATLAQEILERVENHPSAHNQGWWLRDKKGSSVVVLPPTEEPECGTTMCVAGWAAHLSGYLLTSYSGGVSTATLPSAPQRQVPDVARELLDLSEVDAYILFHYTCVEEAILALEQVARGSEHIEWLDVFVDDEDYLDDILKEFYDGASNYDYDYEN